MSESEEKSAGEHFKAATQALSEEHPQKLDGKPEVISQADFEKALTDAGAHVGPPTHEEQLRVGRLDLSEDERTELNSLANRLAKKRATFLDQVLIVAAQLKLLDDSYAFRVQELAGEHRVPEGWRWDAQEMCFRPKA